MSEPKRKKATLPQQAVKKPVEAGLLNEIVDVLSKEAGEGTTQLLGSDGLAIKIRGILSTQCPTIDGAIGRGGIPLGKMTIINGPEASGKTTLTLHLVAECQKQGGIALYVDSEHKLDPEYAANIGVHVKNLIISQPPYVEKFYAITEKCVQMAQAHRLKTGKRVPILVILDSMNASIAKRQYDGDWEDQHMAPQARVHSENLPKLIPLLSKEDVALVFISQIREKIGVMFGDKEDISGGRAPKFYASLILDVRRSGFIKDGDEILGNHTKVYVRKNSIAPPFKTAEFDIIYGQGIDYNGALIARGLQLGIIEKNGNWYSCGTEKLGNGLKQASDCLATMPKMAKRIQESVESHDRRSRKNK